MRLSRSDHEQWLISVAVGCLAFLAFVPAVGFDFVNWDDDRYLFGNEGIVSEGFSPRGVWRACTETVFYNWAPLTVVSYQLDTTLGGAQPWIYHLTNILLHACSSSLLCLALARMTGHLVPSAAVAVLFALHPLRVESVAWVAERKDVLSVFFGVLAIVAYERYCRQPRLSAYLAVAVSLLASLLAKATLVTLPVLLLLCDVWPLARSSSNKATDKGAMGTKGDPFPRWPWSRLVLEKAPLLVLSLVFVAVTIWTQSPVITSDSLLPLLRARVPNAIESIVAYVRDTVAPDHLHPVHVHPGLSALRPHVLTAAILGLIAVGIVATKTRRCVPAAAFGFAWFLISLSPVLGVVKQQGFQARADRFTYVPHVGLLVALVWLAEWMADRLGMSQWTRSVFYGILAFACVLQTERQLTHWRNSDALWSHVLALEPENTHALAQLGAHRFRHGQDADAEQLLFDAIWIEPGLVWPRMYLAQIYFTAKDYRRAQYYRDTALQRSPADVEMRQMAAEMPDLDAQAAAQPKAVRACSPQAREPLAEGLAAARAGRFDEALAAFERAQAADPACAAAANNIGLVLAHRRETEAAITAFRRAVLLDDQASDYHLNLAQMLVAAGRAADARTAASMALRLAPWDTDAAEIRTEVMRRRFAPPDRQQARDRPGPR